MKNSDLLSNLYAGKLERVKTNNKITINTINQYSYVIAKQDIDFKTALLDSDVLLPDGIGIILAHRLLYGLNLKKIAGADIHHFLLEKLNQEEGSCFYLGSSEQTLGKIKARLTSEYPAIRFGAFSPPYKDYFNDSDNADMIEAVNSFKPDVLFVGMTAPKQEKWTHYHKAYLNANVICCIGAVFDFYAGTSKRPNKLLIKLGLEWLGRLLHEPKRLWRRYLYYGPIFIYLILKDKIRKLPQKEISL